MSWSYRVLRHIYRRADGEDEVSYSINGVYYTPTDVPYAVTEDAVGVLADTVMDLADVLDMMRRALREPVLDMLDFEEGGRYYTKTDDIFDDLDNS